MKNLLALLLLFIVVDVSYSDEFDKAVRTGEISQKQLDSITNNFIKEHRLLGGGLDELPYRVRNFIEYYMKNSPLKPSMDANQILVKGIENIKLGPKRNAPFAYRSGNVLLEYWVQDLLEKSKEPKFHMKRDLDYVERMVAKRLKPDMVVAMGIPIDCSEYEFCISQVKKREKLCAIQVFLGFSVVGDRKLSLREEVLCVDGSKISPPEIGFPVTKGAEIDGNYYSGGLYYPE